MQSEPTKQSVCKALHVFYNASSSMTDRNAADSYLQTIKESPNGIKLSIDLFQNTMDSPVLFYCLLIIEYNIDKRFVCFFCFFFFNENFNGNYLEISFLYFRWDELDENIIIMINKLLLSFIGQVCSKDNLFKTIENHVRSKVAQNLVKLMKRQYLTSWQSFFKDLIEILKHGNGCFDIFYRILKDLNWSIHENRNITQEQLTLNNKIKDRMRQYDVQQIVEIWYLFLKNYENYNVELTKQCLESIDKFISWIDISYISSPRFLTILYKFLEIVSFQNESVDCLFEIIMKRMDDTTKKLQLIQNINILKVLNKIDINNMNITNQNDCEEFAESICDLIDGIGIQLTGCCKDNVENSKLILFECYNLALKYFSHPSFKVNQECCEFIFSFWSLIKRQNDRMRLTNNDTINEQQEIIFNKTVELISKNLCYPQDYNVNDPDEAEAEFDEYRKSRLDKVINAMTSCYPQHMLNLIGNHFSQTCQIISNNQYDRKNNDIPWQNIESDLHLIYKVCEGFGRGNIDKLIRNNPKFGNLFEYSLKANICTKHPHPKILLTYLNIIPRYNVFFESHPEYIAQILQLFVMCIQQQQNSNNNNNNTTNNTLRAQSAYTLQKLITKLCQLNSKQVNQVLLQYMDMLIQSLGSCLQIYIQQKKSMTDIDDNKNQNNNNNEIIKGQFDGNDIKNICGGLGQLVLLNKDNKNKLYQHCNKICGIFMNELKHYVLNRDKWININPLLIAEIMCEYITCIQCFFKPFNNKQNNNNNKNESNECIKNILIDFTDIVIKSYSCLPNHDDLRKDSIDFLHKAVYILRDGIINHLNLAFQIYIQYLNTNNCVFTLQIITNIIINLRLKIVPILDNMFYPLFESISNILASFGNNRINTIGNSGYQQEKLLKLDIQRHFYTLLLKIFQCGCYQIFLSNKNGKHFDKVINCIIDGCIIRKDLDVTIYKTCFTILKEMLLAIKNTHPSMKDLYCNKILKLSFHFCLNKNYDQENADFNRTLKTHIFGIHHLMFKIFGNDIITNCIGSYLVTQCNLDTNIAKQYCQLSINYSQNGNQSRKLKQIILSLRSSLINTNTNNFNDYQFNQL